MESATSFGFIMAIGISVFISVLLIVIVLITVYSLRRRVEQSLTMVEEVNSQLRAIRQEFHIKQSNEKVPVPRSRTTADDDRAHKRRPVSADDTIALRRR